MTDSGSDLSDASEDSTSGRMVNMDSPLITDTDSEIGNEPEYGKNARSHTHGKNATLLPLPVPSCYY